MKNNLKKITCSALLLSTLLLSSCAGDGYSTFAVTGPYMTGKTAKMFTTPIFQRPLLHSTLLFLKMRKTYPILLTFYQPWYSTTIMEFSAVHLLKLLNVQATTRDLLLRLEMMSHGLHMMEKSMKSKDKNNTSKPKTLSKLPKLF